MPWKSAPYESVRKAMNPGDIVAFSSNVGFSSLIKMATRSNITHIGIVFQTKLFIYGEAQEGFFNQVMESTVASGTRAGVIANRLSDRVKFYPGDMWWLPLRQDVRDRMDLRAFYNFLLHNEHRSYDIAQAIRSAFDLPSNLPIPGKLTRNAEDFSRFFCSELAAAALEASGAIGSINASEVTPIDLCMFSIYEDDYYQLKGQKKLISGYNTLNPNGWGQE
ncbi:MAG: hypothetical protein ACAF42_07590 [Limnothrix sp. BL-A-16]|jgi:hypothetical protein